MNSWLAGAASRRVVPGPRRRAGQPVIVAAGIVHAIREDLDTAACGVARPAYCLGFWPLDGDVEHCASCAAAVNVATVFTRQLTCRTDPRRG